MNFCREKKKLLNGVFAIATLIIIALAITLNESSYRIQVDFFGFSIRGGTGGPFLPQLT
jgi:hypothetical protein